jgi:hypothetical protein
MCPVADRRPEHGHPPYALVVTLADAITPYADLDEILVELLGHWRRILRDDLVGAYLQGSFALGGGDQQSDCDWLVATRQTPTEQQIAELRALHDEIPTRDGHWPHDLKGSYAPVAPLQMVSVSLTRRQQPTVVRDATADRLVRALRMLPSVAGRDPDTAE